MIDLLRAPVGNGRKALVLIKLLNAPIKVNEVNSLKGETDVPKKEWYLEFTLHNGTPCVVTSNNIELYEGNILLEYIAANYDTENKFHYSLENSPRLNWKQTQWLFFQSYHHAQRAVALAVIWLRDNPTDTIARDFALKCFDSALRTIDEQISKSKSGWFLGDKLTIVDIAFLVGEEGRREVTRGTDWWIDAGEKYPHAEKWYQRALNFDSSIKQILDEYS
ncbi:uncharacterized protein LODBEIA_P16690 [Lodderomyces beijingensis]|uniref:Glutathione S-transferase n=1 Tax=Lodderomyces beijingensis TaxID=1775926 RepID=A0ABP0ZJR8_9ASCO